jgi:hypothetical protein
MVVGNKFLSIDVSKKKEEVLYHVYNKNMITPNKLDLFPTYDAQAAIISALGLKTDDL